MELIRGLHNLRERHRGCVVTIGAFDGLHLGHQALIQHVKQRAAKEGLPSVVATLEPLPREYFAPKQAAPRLMNFREKFLALRDAGIDRVLRIRFNRAMSEMPAEQFIESVFVSGLAAKHIVVGDDLRFGHDREGDFHLLQSMGREHGFTVEDTDTVGAEGQRVSSTRIRKLLLAGEFAQAERLLGKPYSISGKVVYGQQLGRELGAPTANIQLHRLRSALSGVYAVEVGGVDAELVAGVANVGTRPTVNDSIKAILEVHVLNYSGSLYGKRLRVIFRHKIRDEVKFDSVEQLQAQIHQDIATTADYFDHSKKQ